MKSSPRIASFAGVGLRLALLILIVLILGVPINDFWRFLILTIAVMAVCFGSIRLDRKRWLGALGIVLAISAVDWLIPGPRIEEGHNVYIPVGSSLQVFEKELPAEAQRIMLERFKAAYLEDEARLPGTPDWWDDPYFQRPGFLTERAFAASSDALWQHAKYSRIVDAVRFHSQNEAKLDVINRRQIGFYPKKPRHPDNFFSTARLDRDSLPFFVMVELNPALVGGSVCWKGEVLWETEPDKFSLQRNRKFDCMEVQRDQVGKRVFALAIAPNESYAFVVQPNLMQRVALWTKLLLQSVAAFAVLGLLVVIDRPIRLFLPLGAAAATILTTLIYWPDLISGFRTHRGGNDGLTHESFGFDASQALAHGDIWDALKGGEAIFFFMPGLRYFRAAEDFLFGSTAYGIVLFTMFIPIFLYVLLRRLLPLRWSVVLIVVFLFVPIFTRFGFAQHLYVSAMWKGFPEPVGYGAFLGALALIARYVPTRMGPALETPIPTFWIGLALAVSVAMRPNLVVAAAVLLAMLGLWLLMTQRLVSLVVLALGFSSILLVSLHNWYFGGQFVPLTSSAFIPVNLVTPPSIYLAAVAEILRLDWAGPSVVHVKEHLRTWNHPVDLYRLPVLLVSVWVLASRRFDLYLRALALLALTLQLALFFYVPDRRYAYLAWLLAFVVFLVILRQEIVPYVARRFPKMVERVAALRIAKVVAELPR